MKLQGKERRGSRRIRRYDAPWTPFERERACPDTDSRKVVALASLLATTYPFVLSRRIEQHLERKSPYAARGGPSVTVAANEHPVARVDLQPGASRPSSTSGWHLGKNQAHTVGAGATITRPAKGAARKKSAAHKTLESPVRFSDDVTTPNSVRFSDGLTGRTRVDVRGLDMVLPMPL